MSLSKVKYLYGVTEKMSLKITFPETNKQLQAVMQPGGLFNYAIERKVLRFTDVTRFSFDPFN
jgi:hypothetical protein